MAFRDYLAKKIAWAKEHQVTSAIILTAGGVFLGKRMGNRSLKKELKAIKQENVRLKSKNLDLTKENIDVAIHAARVEGAFKNSQYEKRGCEDQLANAVYQVGKLKSEVERLTKELTKQQ